MYLQLTILSNLLIPISENPSPIFDKKGSKNAHSNVTKHSVHEILVMIKTIEQNTDIDSYNDLIYK